MADITMPQLGETVTEGTIIKWFKKVGDEVAQDENLFEVSTDKVDSEVPSTTAGYLAEILVDEGQTVDVGTRLAVISGQPPDGGGGSQDEGATSEAETDETDGAEDGDADSESDAEASATPGPSSETEAAADEPDPDSESRPQKAEAEATATGSDAASGSRRQKTKEPAQAEPPTSAGAAKDNGEGGRSTSPSGGRLLSPVVRKLIAEHGLDPSKIPGTGQDGRITRADVLGQIDQDASGGPERDTAPAPAKAPAKAPAVPAAKPGADDIVVPFSNIRRRTAEHMVRSQATSAHVLTVTEVDFEAVERVRQAAKKDFKAKEGFSLTYLPFVARAVVDAIEDFPHVNASVSDDSLILHRPVHLGFAVDLNFEGLIVPVVHEAESRRLVAIAQSVAELARRARSRELTADDISGSTFTITNPGPFGTFITAPVINQPQVAILSTDGVRKRPVAIELPDGSDAVAIHHVGNLALSFDHRAFDGAYAAAFLGRIRQILETRDWSAEL